MFKLVLQQLLTNGLPFSKKTLFKLVGRYLNSNCIVLLRYLMGFIVHRNYFEIIARLWTLVDKSNKDTGNQ